MIFLSHRHTYCISMRYVWQEHIFPVTLLSHTSSLVTAMWQERNLPVTHNTLILRRCDSVTGKTRKNFFLWWWKTSSLNHIIVSFLFRCNKPETTIQVQSSSNSAPIQVQSEIGIILDLLCMCICIDCEDYLHIPKRCLFTQIDEEPQFFFFRVVSIREFTYLDLNFVISDYWY